MGCGVVEIHLEMAKPKKWKFCVGVSVLCSKIQAEEKHILPQGKLKSKQDYYDVSKI